MEPSWYSYFDGSMEDVHQSKTSLPWKPKQNDSGIGNSYPGGFRALHGGIMGAAKEAHGKLMGSS